MDKKAIIAGMLANGAQAIKGVKVKSVSVTPKENHTCVTFVTDKDNVPMYVDDGTGNYELKDGNFFSVSLYGVVAPLRDNEDISPIVSRVTENPDSAIILLNGATLDVIVEKVAAGEVYKSPWSEDAEEKTFEHDTTIYHITNVALGKIGKIASEKIMNDMLGIR